MLLCEYKAYFSTPKRIIRCIYQHDFTLSQTFIVNIHYAKYFSVPVKSSFVLATFQNRISIK